MRTALLAACAVAAFNMVAAHPCASVAATHSGGFASSCHADVAGALPGRVVPVSAAVVVYACVPLNDTSSGSAAGDFAARVDPLLRTFTPNAFVGRLVPSALRAAQAANASDMRTWDGTVALAFELEHEELLERNSGTSLLCTRGVVHAVEPGEYAFEVVHEHGGYRWDAPWDPDAPVSFGQSLLLPGAAEPQTEPLPSTGELLLVSAIAPRSPQTDCSRGVMDGTWRGGHYVPAGCKLRNVTWPAFDACMARLNGTVHLLGDSNSRRTFKALFTRGAWCPPGTELAHSHCLCEDCGNVCASAPENATVPLLHDAFAAAGAYFGTGVVNVSDGRSATGGVSRLVLHSMTGYAPGRLRAVASTRPDERTAAVVVAGFGAWPEVRLNLSTYVAQLAAMLDELASLVASGAIGPDVPIIFRPAMYACCASAPGHRFSSKRGAVMTRLFRRAVRAAFPRAMWWDSRALGENRPLGDVARQSRKCYSNHMDARLVHEDARLLMHLLCVAADALPMPHTQTPQVQSPPALADVGQGMSPRRAALALAVGRLSALSSVDVVYDTPPMPMGAAAGAAPVKRYPDAAHELASILEAYREQDVVLFQVEAHNRCMYMDQARSLCVRLRRAGLPYIAFGASEAACHLLDQPGCVLYTHSSDTRIQGLTWRWSKRYNLLADLAVAGKNALLLDVDTAVHVNPFPLLKQIEGAKMVVLAEGGLGNGGFNFLPAASEKDDAVRLLRRCVIDWVKAADEGKSAKMDQDLLGAAVDEYTTGPWSTDTTRTYSTPMQSLGHPPEWGQFRYVNMSLERRVFKSGGSVFRAPPWIVTSGGDATYGWSWHDVPPSSALTHLLGVETAFVPEVLHHGSHVGRVLYAMAFGYVDVPCEADLTSVATSLVDRAANESFDALQTLMRNAYYASLATDTLLVVPKIPCSAPWLKRSEQARFGVHDRRVIATESGCFLTAGGWDDCWPSEHVCYPFQLRGSQRSPLMHKHHYSVLREEPIPLGKEFHCPFFGDGKPKLSQGGGAGGELRKGGSEHGGDGLGGDKATQLPRSPSIP